MSPEPFAETEFRHIAVIGAGTMGHGIAQVCAMAGANTYLWDSVPGQAKRAEARIRGNLDAGVSRGKLTPRQRDEALARLRRADSLRSAADGAQLVIEAVPERIDLKQEIFATLGAISSPAAILATNTSSLSVSDIATAVATPWRVIGLHFFNPVHLMRLLEVVRGRETSAETVATALRFARFVAKEPIVVSDSPGFATSRLGVVLGLEAMRMIEQEVATPEDIDRAMTLGYNHPVGPLRLSDVIGLDTRLEIARHLFRSLGSDQYRPPQILERLVAQGKLGQKSGEGFYRWDAE
jgi:3-hydroxybutyryl-CoA dehydrogenase